jgi:hypothetical protein
MVGVRGAVIACSTSVRTATTAAEMSTRQKSGIQSPYFLPGKADSSCPITSISISAISLAPSKSAAGVQIVR